MPSKRQRNKSAQARARQQSAKQEPTAAEDTDAVARREQQKREWADRKRAKDRSSVPVALYAWLGGGGVLLAAVVIVALVLSGGGGSSSSTPTPAPTEDPRVAGLPVAQTVDISANDQGQNINPTYSKTTIVGKAGDVIEIRMTNDGSVAHNLHVAGEDNQYSDDPSADDFITDPQSVKPGETGVVKVKIDKAGTYKFHCDFHPDAQLGTIVLS